MPRTLWKLTYKMMGPIWMKLTSRLKTVTADDTPYTSAMAFEDLNLSAELLKVVYTEIWNYVATSRSADSRS